MGKRWMFIMVVIVLLATLNPQPIYLAQGAAESAAPASAGHADTPPGATSARTNGGSVYLPLIFRNYVREFRDGFAPRGGVCPAGYHLVHASGRLGITAPDTEEYRDGDYRCLPNMSLEDVSCSAFGEAVIIDGVATCACAEGYAGESCTLCAPGYGYQAALGQCVQRAPVVEVAISGGDASIEHGQVVTLTASADGVARFSWSIREGDAGCFEDAAGGCQQTLEGLATVAFRAPASGEPLGITQIAAAPVGGGAVFPGVKNIVYTAPGAIPVTGQGHANLQPILRSLSDFMDYRCIGGGVIGVSYYGKPVGIWGLGRMDGRASLNSRPECGNATQNPFYPNAPLVQPTTPFRLGSISKSVTAAIGRRAVKQTWTANNFGFTPFDATIEALPLVNTAGTSLGVNMLPSTLNAVYSRQLTVPYVYTATFGNFADPRWISVTLGHLLAHRSGMQRDGDNDYLRHSVNSIPTLRNLLTNQGNIDTTKLAEQEALLTAIYGAAAVNNARTAMAAAAGVPASRVYFVPQPTLREFLHVVAARPLLHNPDDYIHQYSNDGPGYIIIIAENLKNKRFAADNGNPASHTGSLLHEFFLEELGVPTTGQSGIFRAHLTTPFPPGDPEPKKRIWNGEQNTYYPVSWDTKRPHCIVNNTGTSCNFNSWRLATHGRISWSWQRAEVPLVAEWIGVNAGSGELVTDPGTFLKFLNKYWVGGYDENPRIGERRLSAGSPVWNLYTTHNGALFGAMSWAMQLGKQGEPLTYRMPPRTPNGRSIASDQTLRTPNFLLAPNINGQVVSYDADGYPINAFFHEVGGFAVGRPDVTGKHKLYIATSAWGRLTLYEPSGAQIAQYDIGFADGDRLLVGDIDNDIFDEILLIKASGQIRIHDHNGVFLRSVALNIGANDQVALGRLRDQQPNRIFIARAAQNRVVSINLDNLADVLIFNVPFKAGDGFAVGNVIGTYKDEIVVGDHVSGKVTVYNYDLDSKDYGPAAEFQGFFENGSRLAINTMPDTGFFRNEIIIGQPSTGKIRIFRATAEDNTVFNHIQTLKTVGDNENLYTAGAFLAAGSLYDGPNLYVCSTANGAKRSLPVGVDIIVSINQWNVDRACATDPTVNCGAAYGMLHDFIIQGVCQVNWLTVLPLDEIAP